MDKRVVVITGASSGIGRALALEFAAHGDLMVLGARREDELILLSREIEESGGTSVYKVTDVTIEKDSEALISYALEKYGCIDVLINNAGISMRALFRDASVDVIKRLMDVNFWGTVYCTKAALPALLEAKGTVVTVSSIAGIKGLPGRTGYSASKFALQGFMESLRTENLKTGLNVLMVYPGFTASNIRNTALVADGSQQGESPLNEGKIMSAEEVAKHVYKAVQKKKKKLVLTAEGKLTNLLSKFMPYFLEKKIYEKMAKEPGSPFK
ncbi:MAG: SDR family oxidoreductase [Bacteroidales bacterium]|nr:SDR family oxidoreductase [Bacteroidales bacterium]